MSNPFTGYRVTSTWQDHLDRGSAGGIDYGMGVGTPLPAPSDGVLTNIPYNGTGGHTAVITRPDGTRTYYMHLSRFTTPRTVKEGDIVGYSGGAKGADGAGNSTGPHLHAHDVDASGKRVPPFSTAYTPTPAPTVKDDDMKHIYIDNAKLPDLDKRVIIGELTWTHVTGAESTRERKLYGIQNFTIGEAQAELVQVNNRRAQLNLPPIVDDRIASINPK